MIGAEIDRTATTPGGVTEPLAVITGAEIEIGSASEKIEIRRNRLIYGCILFHVAPPISGFRQRQAFGAGSKHHQWHR